MEFITTTTSPICSTLGYGQNCSSFLAKSLVVGGVIIAGAFFYQWTQKPRFQASVRQIDGWGRPNGEWMKGFDSTGEAKRDEFLVACKAGRIHEVRQWKGPLHQQDAKGRSALMLSCLAPTYAVFNHLIKKLTPIEMQALDKTGKNALFYACFANHYPQVVALKAKGVPVIQEKPDGSVPEEYATDPRIGRLLGTEGQAIIDQSGRILQECVAKHGQNFQAAFQEYTQRTGLNPRIAIAVPHPNG